MTEQIPVDGNPSRITQNLGHSAIDIRSNTTFNKAVDLKRLGNFNFSTWFSTSAGKGYWEYMNHRWSEEADFQPGDCPRIEHQPELPKLKGNFLTLYGVVPVTPFQKAKK